METNNIMANKILAVYGTDLNKSEDITQPKLVDPETKLRDFHGKGEFDADGIEKAEGEGSRGGHVIAHTDSGKPIYEDHNHPSHHEFTKEDHRNAADAHDGLRKHHWNESFEHDKRELDLQDHELFGPKYDEIAQASHHEHQLSRQHEVSKYHHLQQAINKD